MRRRALDEFLNSANKADAPLVMRMLHDREPFVRLYGLFILERTEMFPTATTIREATRLTLDPDDNVRGIAYSFEGNDIRKLRVILARGVRDLSPFVAAHAAAHLSQVASKKELPLLVSFLASSRRPDTISQQEIDVAQWISKFAGLGVIFEKNPGIFCGTPFVHVVDTSFRNWLRHAPELFRDTWDLPDSSSNWEAWDEYWDHQLASKRISARDEVLRRWDLEGAKAYRSL
jgi:hypothetical protein